MKLAANLSYLWPELPFLDRFDAAAAAGFEAVEVHQPYEFGAHEIQRAMRRSGLRLLRFNAPPPNYTGGQRGFAATPGGQARFQHDMRRVFRYAEVLNAPLVHIVAGNGGGEDAFSTMVANLKWASRNARKGLVMTIEPLSETYQPGSFLTNYTQAVRVLDAVKKPNVRLMFDCSNAQEIHGDVVDAWRRYGLRTAHVQLSDAPDHAAPGLGNINFADLLAAIRESGYSNWLGAAYRSGPRSTEESLSWMESFRGAAA